MPDNNVDESLELAEQNPVNLKALPYRVRFIAELLGMNETYQLLEKHCFDTLYIPPNLLRSSLDKKIGEKAAKALIQLWPNQTITLPKPDKIMQQWRNHELLIAKRAGTLSTADASKKYNLTRQRINQIENENTENPNLTLDFTL